MQTLHKKDHLANTCKHYHCLWVCLWLLLWVWLELNHFLMASFWRWFCWKQWLCVCVFPCLALSSCTRINKQYINSITEITAPRLEGPSHPHTYFFHTEPKYRHDICMFPLLVPVCAGRWTKRSQRSASRPCVCTSRRSCPARLDCSSQPAARWMPRGHDPDCTAFHRPKPNLRTALEVPSFSMWHRAHLRPLFSRSAQLPGLPSNTASPMPHISTPHSGTDNLCEACQWAGAVSAFCLNVQVSIASFYDQLQFSKSYGHLESL